MHESNGAYISQPPQGAHDVVLNRCTSYARMVDTAHDGGSPRRDLRQNKQMADKALRVLCTDQPAKMAPASAGFQAGHAGA